MPHEEHRRERRDPLTAPGTTPATGGQFMAAHFDEMKMLTAAYALERGIRTRIVGRTPLDHAMPPRFAGYSGSSP